MNPTTPGVSARPPQGPVPHDGTHVSVRESAVFCSSDVLVVSGAPGAAAGDCYVVPAGARFGTFALAVNFVVFAL